MQTGGSSSAPALAMEVRIWGARGSVPTPEAANLGVGGNTACVEIRLPSGESFIFDAGTGIRKLGMQLARQTPVAGGLHIFLTHFHWDHLQGLPFFPPLYSAANTITFHSGCSEEKLQQVLRGQMSNPYFPVRFDLVAAPMSFEQLGSEGASFGPLRVSTFALHHPGGACGFLIEAAGARVVYATDHEHGDPEADAALLAAARNADVLIYDAQFTPEEYEEHRGWGHSTWLEATRIAAAAGVRQLVLFHHDPGHTDEQMRSILTKAQAQFPSTQLATEGLTLAVPCRPA